MTHKLHVRIGEHEFSAEGDQSAVEQQYGLFLHALSSLSRPREQSRRLPSYVYDALEGAQVFGKEDDGTVVLFAHPQTQYPLADAYLLLLLGYAAIGRRNVASSRLLESARQSGFRADRVDKILSTHAAYFVTGGYRRGKTYRLNDLGLDYALTLLRELESGVEEKMSDVVSSNVARSQTRTSELASDLFQSGKDINGNENVK